MGKEKRSAIDILKETTETLNTARFGMSLVQSEDPEQRKFGLRNIIVFGRAVTNVLQNLRSVVAGFDEWYEPWVARMKADPVMTHLYKVRSEILKEGRLTPTQRSFGGFSSAALQPLMKNPPPGATDFFMGDPWGGSGWVVTLPNGEVEKYYISLQNVPGITLRTSVFLADAPPDLKDMTIQEICHHYLEELSAIVNDAKDRFRNE
jgi:hypothetical protein